MIKSLQIYGYLYFAIKDNDLIFASHLPIKLNLLQILIRIEKYFYFHELKTPRLLDDKMNLSYIYLILNCQGL